MLEESVFFRVMSKRKTPEGKGRRGKRKQAEQPGHPKQERPEFPPEMLDQVWEFQLSQCPVCGDALLPSDQAPKTVQQVEIIETLGEEFDGVLGCDLSIRSHL